MNEDCIFCDLVNRKIDSKIIYEEKNVLAFLDIDPINDAHILVIPKFHVLDIDELTEIELMQVMKVVNKMVKVLKNTYEIDGYSILQNGGEFNDTRHLHFHVFPRYKNDGFGWTYKDFEFRNLGEVLEELKLSVENMI